MTIEETITVTEEIVTHLSEGDILAHKEKMTLILRVIERGPTYVDVVLLGPKGPFDWSIRDTDNMEYRLLKRST